MDITVKAYSTWLQGYNWDYFFTSTFRRPRRDPYYALKNVYKTLRQTGAVRAFLAAEPHKSGDLHIHGLFSGPTGRRSGEMYLPWYIQAFLEEDHGFSKVGLCNSQEAVSNYCAKYVLKSQQVADHYAVFGAKRWWKRGRA